MSPTKRRSVLGAAIMLGAAVVTTPTAAAQPSTGPVIAEVYGGGGNSGATLTNDFVELATTGTEPATVDGFSVQYLPADPSPRSQWQVTELAGSVPGEGRYLVAENRGSGGNVELPAPDATGSISMSAGAGTVALVEGAEPLPCLTASDCAAADRIVDLVGYGNAVIHEGSPAPGLDNTSSDSRAANPVDTDDNSADFTEGDPSPTNSKGETPGEPPQQEPTSTTIHEVQGTTRTSPLAGERVSVSGVVTAKRPFGARGYWIQSTEPDSDARTSEGLFVYTGDAAPDVRAGDEVLVTGAVQEYYPGDPADTPFQSLTELTDPTWTVASSGNPVPGPTAIAPDTLPTDLSAKPGGNIEPRALEPAKYSLDFWEAHESELISVTDVRIVGPSTEYHELYVTTKPEQHRTARGGAGYWGYDMPNTGVLKVESLIPFSEREFPQANTGDTLTGTTSGPVEYSRFGGYTLFASTLGHVRSGGLQREVTRDQRSGELAVATYNLENLSAVDSQAKFDALAEGIVKNLSGPDIVALEEIQDNNGTQGVGDGVVAADETLNRLVDAIVAAGGPRYEWRQINPADLSDGGVPGGNIRVGFLVNPERVSFVDRPGGDATTAVEVTANSGEAQLSISPGRVSPQHDAWFDSRKPLAGEFVFRGRTVFVIANHFASKGGDEPIHGRFQPPTRSSEQQRIQQAQVLRGFVDELLAADPDANVVVAGDLNDYTFSPTVRRLTTDRGLTALMGTIPQDQRYTYIYEGNSQVLDHILVSDAPQGVDYDVVHTNAEFAEQVSDHDPQVMRFRPGTGNPFRDAVYAFLDYLDRWLSHWR